MKVESLRQVLSVKDKLLEYFGDSLRIPLWDSLPDAIDVPLWEFLRSPLQDSLLSSLCISISTAIESQAGDHDEG
jgi:hypothetical protein